jgi:hypothetical protein
MKPTRRAVLLAAAAMGAASASNARQAVPGRPRRLLIDGARVRHPCPADALVIPAGVFLDPERLAAAPPGDYEARLMPANRFLLLEMLRHDRIPHAVLDDVVLFRS